MTNFDGNPGGCVRLRWRNLRGVNRGGGNSCSLNPNTRGQMAVFLQMAFNVSY